MIVDSTYYITITKTRKGYEILYSIGDLSKDSVVLRVGGKNADKMFEVIVEFLKLHGGVIPYRISDSEKVYAIRDDLGPIVGAQLILMRRARNMEKWYKLFSQMLDDKLYPVATILPLFLEISLHLSRFYKQRNVKGGYTISSVVLDAVSASMKELLDKIAKVTKEEV